MGCSIIREIFIRFASSLEVSKSCSPTRASTSSISSMSLVQWAAVKICFSLIIVPPQIGVWRPDLTRATCHGNSFGLASTPLIIFCVTISSPATSVFVLAIPHSHGLSVKKNSWNSIPNPIILRISTTYYLLGYLKPDAKFFLDTKPISSVDIGEKCNVREL